MNRALPSTTIDLIRDGASKADLRKRGDRAVWSALVSTAASAQQHGWSYPEWADLVTSVRSMLGRQSSLKRNGRKEIPAVERETVLRNAWAKAGAWLEQKADRPITREDVDAKAKALRNLVADPDVQLKDADRAVLAYAIEQASQRGTDRPTLPRRSIQEATGLGERTVRNSLARLDEAGLLRCEIRGRPSGPRSRVVRASAYRLPDPSTLTALTMTREPEMPTMSAPPPPVPRVLSTVTLENPSPELLADLAELLARHGRADAPLHTNSLPGNVVPIRKGRTA